MPSIMQWLVLLPWFLIQIHLHHYSWTRWSHLNMQDSLSIHNKRDSKKIASFHRLESETLKPQVIGGISGEPTVVERLVVLLTWLLLRLPEVKH